MQWRAPEAFLPHLLLGVRALDSSTGVNWELQSPRNTESWTLPQAYWIWVWISIKVTRWFVFTPKLEHNFKISTPRQNSKELGKFFGKWKRKTETDSWTNWPGNFQPDTEGHLPRDDSIQASAAFQLRAQKSSRIRWATPEPITKTTNTCPVTEQSGETMTLTGTPGERMTVQLKRSPETCPKVPSCKR